jgi:hypothetical protein
MTNEIVALLQAIYQQLKPAETVQDLRAQLGESGFERAKIERIASSSLGEIVETQMRLAGFSNYDQYLKHLATQKHAQKIARNMSKPISAILRGV